MRKILIIMLLLAGCGSGGSEAQKAAYSMPPIEYTTYTTDCVRFEDPTSPLMGNDPLDEEYSTLTLSPAGFEGYINSIGAEIKYSGSVGWVEARDAITNSLINTTSMEFLSVGWVDFPFPLGMFFNAPAKMVFVTASDARAYNCKGEFNSSPLGFVMNGIGNSGHMARVRLTTWTD